MLWKNIFHTVGKNSPIFPRYGKLFRDFSTLWKECFHGVENFNYGPVLRGFQLFVRAVERSPQRPLSIVERDRPRAGKNGARRRRAVPSAAPASGAA